MKPIRKLFAATVLAAGGLAAAAAGISIASAADDEAPPPDAMGGPGGGGPGGWHHHGPHGEGHFFRELNLTDAQKASMKAIMTASGPQMKSVHEQMHANEEKLRGASPNDPGYASVVSEVSQANGTLFAQAETQRASIRAQMFKLLTPAQQSQLVSLEAQAAQKHADWAAAHPGPN